MKKTLKICLILLLAVCMLPLAPLAQIDVLGATPLLTDREVSMLYTLGFYPEVPDNELYITRARYVKMMGKLMGMENMDMNSAIVLGLLDSFDDGGAGENSNIRYGEVVRGLLTALGYDKQIALKGHGADAYRSTAAQLGLTNWLDLTDNSPVTPATFAVMIYRTLKTPMLLQTSYGEVKRFTQDNDVTMLSYIHDIYYAKGQVTDNGFSSFMGQSEVGEYNVRIGDMILTKGNVGEEFLLGYYTEFYYHEEQDDRTLLWIWADGGKNDEIYVTAQKLIKYNEEGSYVYDKDGKVMEVDLEPGSLVLYNGKAVSMADLTEEQRLPSVGEITFLDVDRNGIHEVVIIMDYMVDTVSYFDKNGNKLYFTNEGIYPISDTAIVRITNGRYKPINPDEIKDGQTLWCASSLDGKYVTILVSETSVTGTIEAIDYIERRLVISGNEYAINRKSFANIESYLKLGASGTFYLDIEDAVVDFDKNIDDFKFAYLIRAAVEDNMDAKLVMQVFDGEIRTLDIIDKVKVNGINYSDYEEILNLLGGETVKPQLICFKENAENLVSEMQYVEDYTPTANGGQKLHVAGISPKRNEGQALLYKHSGWLFGNYFALQDNAPVFILPVDRYDLDGYALGNPSNIGNDDHHYGVTGFKLDERSDACVAAVWDDEQQVSVNNNPGSILPLIVKNVTRVLMDNGQEGTRINYYDTDGKLGYALIDDEETDFEELKAVEIGDVIRLDMSGDKIVDFSIDYNFIENVGRDSLLTVAYDQSPKISWGKVYRRNEHTILLDSPAKASGREYIDYELVQLNRANRILFVEVNNGKLSVRVGAEQEVLAGDLLYYTSSYGFIRNVVVFK